MLFNESKQKVEEQEYDISDDILEWYKKIYSGKGGLGDYFDLENLCKEKGKRAYYKAKENAISDEYAKLIDISGDIVFNFSEKGLRGQSRYEILKKYINEISDSDLKEIYIHRLDYCKEHHHSKENCALIPKQGNLQNAKQGIGNDRGDTFIWALDEYFENNVEILLNFATYEHKKILINYLETLRLPGKHQSVYHYCELFFNITDTRFINELIVFGSKTIDSEFRARKYIDLALNFWKKRSNYYDKISR